MSSGEQFAIVSGSVRAVVTEVGGGLRELTVGGAPLVESYDEDEDPPMGAGTVLVPWPNRTAGARWSWRGREQHLEVTGPDGHAIHGLLRRVPWTRVAGGDDHVTLGADVPAGTPGWPQPLHVETTYRVRDAGGGPAGLEVHHVVTNVGDGDCPVALGVHPYLRVGDTPVAECTLTVPAERVLDVDGTGIPHGAPRPVGPAEDLRDPRPVRELQLDASYTGVGPAGADEPGPGDGAERVLGTLGAPDGSSTRVWGDAAVRWVQVFTPDDLAGRGKAVAVEPGTAPPDALNSGTDLTVLAPGGHATVRWGLVGAGPTFGTALGSAGPATSGSPA